ncbi:M16 family metallopeptidase [Meridianimarinicoccus aquatilis]|uniref:Insulinase family protein n=1 Tax=Meridianimarinicoccus aquatilis TaxID=2552766 RepID=A0A4R6B435_9RHOB|nr:pitrilysin family protein [Fluviibacterium aquatile]QIE40636.1 insulinase family protein [Rhodobacteraceae bacterium SC52]TDL91145.1 insulinase family protein [Fluviibacterium aquatile]
MSVEIHKLSNGLRIVTERMPGLKSASIGLWITAGGRHERLEQNGIAHFLEHMAFKGTKRRSALQIAEAIEDVGGYINAYTSREMTAYYARVLEDDVMLALDVISDIILNPVMDPAEIEVERGVILQEIGQALDTPDDIVFDWLQEVTFPDQPIGRTILGETDRVKGFSRDDLFGFVGERYGPDQMILSAAGSVDHDQIVAEAEKLFGHLKPSLFTAATPARFTCGEHRTDKALEQAHLAIALEGPSYRDEDIYTAQVFATALGGGMSSRLFQEVREKRGLCYTIFAQASAYSDTGMTMIYAGTSGEQLGELARITVDELRKATDTLKSEELARARAQMKAGLLMGLESPSTRAERLARLVAIWDRIPPLEETVDLIEGATAARIRDYGTQLVARAPVSMAVYGPVSGAPTLEELRGRLAA